MATITDAVRVASKSSDLRHFPTLFRYGDWEVGTGSQWQQWDAAESKTAGVLSDQFVTGTSFTDGGGHVWTPREGTRLARLTVAPETFSAARPGKDAVPDG